MTYKETLFFVGKCLTITHEKHNKRLVERELKSGEVDWDNIVKLSTSHYVFPALYCNLKRANFLHYLPNDLVNYMKHITDLNRERNLQIIEQAKEINQLLLDKGITPIFLKGTGNLLEGLYEDIAERMVGDIDFLVSKNLLNSVVKILKDAGYFKKESILEDYTMFSRHYPKIIKKEKIAAVEIHTKMLSQELLFSYDKILQNIETTTNNIYILSYEDQVLMTCINKQLNDKGQWYKNISLRNSYDLFLLSKFTSVNDTIQSYNNSITSYLNNFVASSNLVFNNVKSLHYQEDLKTQKFINKVLYYIEHPKKLSINKKKWNFFLFTKERCYILLKSFYKKDYFYYTYNRLFNFKWYKKKLNL